MGSFEKDTKNPTRERFSLSARWWKKKQASSWERQPSAQERINDADDDDILLLGGRERSEEEEYSEEEEEDIMQDEEDGSDGIFANQEGTNHRENHDEILPVAQQVVVRRNGRRRRRRRQGRHNQRPEPIRAVEVDSEHVNYPESPNTSSRTRSCSFFIFVMLAFVILGALVSTLVIVRQDRGGGGNDQLANDGPEAEEDISSRTTNAPTLPPPLTTESPSVTPSSAPTGTSGVAFTTTEELMLAVNSYWQDSSGPDTLISQTYGHPMNYWNVSLITDFAYLFSTVRPADLPPGNATAVQTFNENIADWDLSSAETTQAMFQGKCANQNDRHQARALFSHDLFCKKKH